MTRVVPHVAVRRLVRNYSLRNGARPALIVIHATEGHNRPQSIADLVNLGAWFDDPRAQASSHVATDGDGTSARFVWDGAKAWHVVGFNRVSLGIEQVWAPGDQWTDVQVKETARWVARWSRMHGIPIREGAVSGQAVVRAGVIRHSQLGTFGGGHHDPGDAYPFKTLLRHARWYARQS
jgi:N-acetyl-anhydromuramyl-L-alanine amidase AmpD